MKKKIDLLNGSILSTLTRLTLPIMATSLIQMAYNLTDMVWVPRVEAQTVAAVGTAGMYTQLSQGIAIPAEMGSQIKVTHSLGEEKPREAAVYAQGAIQVGIVFGILFAVVAVAFARPLVGFFGLSDAVVIDGVESYLRIVCGGIVFSYLNAILAGIFTVQGDSRTPFKANFIGLAANIVLDPLLIFGFSPVPRMEAAGAAITMVTAQMIVTAVFVGAAGKDFGFFGQVYLLSRTPWDYLNTTMRLEMSSAAQNLLYAGISAVLTRFVTSWGDLSVAAQKVGSQVESISWMTAGGLAAAINPFVEQNHGGKQYKRVKYGYFITTGVMFVWGIICSLALVFLEEPIFRLFISEPDIVPIGVSYLTVLGFSQMFMCIELTTVGALSDTGRAFLCSAISIVFTSSRASLAMIFSRTALGPDGIWWAVSISSIVKGIVFFITFLTVSRKLMEGTRQ